MHKTHELKIEPKYFNEVMNGNKKFELRKNDRDYKIGDVLILKEFNENKYIGNEVTKQIKYIIYGPCYGLEEGYCVMSLGNVKVG